MLTIHHLGVSQSERVVWLCEELEVPYELKRYERDPETRLAPPEYRRLHAFGTAPVITDGKVVLGESGAIIEYILAKYGGGRLSVGPDRPNFPDYLFWFHFANGSLMPSAMIDMVVQPLAGAGAGLHHVFTERLERAYEMIEQRLGEVDYFAGDEFTAADIMMLFPLTTMRLFAPREVPKTPNLVAYLQRIGDRHGYRAARIKADPDLQDLA